MLDSIASVVISDSDMQVIDYQVEIRAAGEKAQGYRDFLMERLAGEAVLENKISALQEKIKRKEEEVKELEGRAGELSSENFKLKMRNKKLSNWLWRITVAARELCWRIHKKYPSEEILSQERFLFKILKEKEKEDEGAKYNK